MTVFQCFTHSYLSTTAKAAAAKKEEATKAAAAKKEEAAKAAAAKKEEGEITNVRNDIKFLGYCLDTAEMNENTLTHLVF